MDDRAFARQLCAWLDPFRLASLALEYSRDPASLERRGRATREARSFRRAADVGLDRLIRAFLQNFELFADIVAILPGASQLSLPTDALARLTGLRFTGEASFENFDESDPEGAVVAFRGSGIEILTIAGPINFLVRFVDQIVDMWSPLDRDRAFYEPSFHTELPIYIESTVARALGFRVQTAFTSGKPGVNARLNGVVTMVGSPPFDRRGAVESWSLARQGELPAPRLVSDERTAAVFADADGMILLDPEEAAEPWRNIERFRNECSPYSGIERPRARSDGKLMIDSQYGRAFDFVLTEASAVYGFTDDLARVTHPADLGYLRVPYRCVPRIRVGSRAELERIFTTLAAQAQVAGRADIRLLIRGQTREYYVNRSPAALRALYGDAQALEPSLPASAVRKQQPLEGVMPEWCFFIRSYMLGLTTRLINDVDPSLAERLGGVLQADRQRLEESLDNHAFALSLAQHYGLPSMGLDLTDQLDTALFFALYRFEVTEGRRLRVVRDNSGQSVLYVLLFPERFCVEHARARPSLFPKGRPDTQSAWFSHMGWGYRRNQCAEYLVAALYLDESGDFGELPTVVGLFPSQPNDMFGSLMEAALTGSWVGSGLREYLMHLYWVAE
jgi:hypothetical protein